MKQCRIYDTACIDPSFCDRRDACCAGDPNCVAPTPVMSRAHLLAAVLSIEDRRGNSIVFRFAGEADRKTYLEAERKVLA